MNSCEYYERIRHVFMQIRRPILAPERIEVVDPARNSEAKHEEHHQDELMTACCGVGIRQFVGCVERPNFAHSDSWSSQETRELRACWAVKAPDEARYNQATEEVSQPFMGLISLLKKEVIGHDSRGQRPMKEFYKSVPRHCFDYFFLTMSPVLASK